MSRNFFSSQLRLFIARRKATSTEVLENASCRLTIPPTHLAPWMLPVKRTPQLTQTQMRCLILEADRDAEALRAEKYRKILESLAGEDGPTQPHVPRGALVSPCVSTCVVA